MWIALCHDDLNRTQLVHGFKDKTEAMTWARNARRSGGFTSVAVYWSCDAGSAQLARKSRHGCSDSLLR